MNAEKSPENHNVDHEEIAKFEPLPPAGGS